VNYKLPTALAACLTLASCAAPLVPEPAICGGRLPAALAQMNIKQIVSEMTTAFCPTTAGPVNPMITDQDVVVVPDFVDVSSHATGFTGVVLGEVTRGSLSTICGHKVRQVDLGRALRLSADGVVALTRDASKIANPEFISRWGYIGTFASMPGKAILTLRELDMHAGMTTRLVTKEIVFGCRLDAGRYRFEYTVN